MEKGITSMNDGKRHYVYVLVGPKLMPGQSTGTGCFNREKASPRLAFILMAITLGNFH